MTADWLLSRFNDEINAITVLGEPEKSGLTGIDTMMNLPLLWWNHEETGKRRYYKVASRHATMTILRCIRDDSSTYHEIDFDPGT